jgi:hypothetical protein
LRHGGGEGFLHGFFGGVEIADLMDERGAVAACGVRRDGATETRETPASLALTLGLDETPAYATTPLTSEMLRRPISGPLVASVTGSLHVPTTAQLRSRWSRSLLLALTSLSIWVMIVLLSPLDAYAAARVTVAR